MVGLEVGPADVVNVAVDKVARVARVARVDKVAPVAPAVKGHSVRNSIGLKRGGRSGVMLWSSCPSPSQPARPKHTPSISLEPCLSQMAMPPAA